MSHPSSRVCFLVPDVTVTAVGLRLAILTAWVCVACSNRVVPASPPAVVATPAPLISDDEIFHQLDIKFGTTGAVPAAMPDRKLRLRAFIADRMTQSAFYDHVAPEFTRMASSGGSLTVFPHTLKHDDADFFYLDNPCAPADRIAVAPWWNLGTTVKICRDDVRPDVTSYQADGITSYCEGSERPFERRFDSPCRCGANLVHCATPELQKKMIGALDDEQIRTFEYIVEQKLPFSTSVMTIDRTVRSDLADFFYARATALQTGTLTYPVPQEGSVRVRPRPAHFDIGLLTTWPWLSVDDGVRSRVAGLWGMTLCSNLKSSNVNPEQMFASLHSDTPKAGNFRYSVHLELATSSGCESCHRVLEHAALAMQAYPVARFGSRYLPSEQSAGTTQLFVGDDARAEGPATVEWLARSLAAQPEFQSCVVDTTLHFLFDGYDTPDPQRRHLIDAFTKTQSFAQLFSDAVVMRYLPEAR